MFISRVLGLPPVPVAPAPGLAGFLPGPYAPCCRREQSHLIAIAEVLSDFTGDAVHGDRVYQPLRQAQANDDVGDGSVFWQFQRQRGGCVRARAVVAQQPVKADLDIQLLLSSTGRSPL